MTAAKASNTGNERDDAVDSRINDVQPDPRTQNSVDRALAAERDLLKAKSINMAKTIGKNVILGSIGAVIGWYGHKSYLRNQQQNGQDQVSSQA